MIPEYAHAGPGRRETADHVRVDPEATAEYHRREELIRPTHRVTPDVVRPAAAGCRECGRPTPWIRWDGLRSPAPNQRYDFSPLGDLAAAFDGGCLGPPTCPRCRMLASAPTAMLGLSSVPLSAAGDDGRLRVAAGRDRYLDPPADAILEAGHYMVTLAAKLRLKGGYGGQADPVLALSRLLSRHQRGDFGDVGRSGATGPADADRGILGSRLSRNLAAIRSGRGDVVSSYPRADGPPLVLWTTLSAARPHRLTLACMGDESCCPKAA